MRRIYTNPTRTEGADGRRRDFGAWTARRPFASLVLLALLVLVAAGASGCGVFGRGNEEATGDLALFRTPHPTFTPTVGANAAAPVAQPPASTEAGAEQPRPEGSRQVSAPSIPEPSFVDPPRAVVSAPLVNLRSAPGLDSIVVAIVERGAEFEVVGRSSDAEWWQVCCQEGQVVWIARELVDTDGAVDSVPAADGSAASTVATGFNTPQTETVTPGLGGSSAGQARFELIAKEQFPESSLVRIYLYVYEGANALAGYRVRVTKDGREIPVSAQSFGGQPAFTWPFQDARQRFQNLKIEFPDEQPAGAWIVQLTDSQGTPVGPPAEFSLGENDPNQELYVRYERSE